MTERVPLKPGQAADLPSVREVRIVADTEHATALHVYDARTGREIYVQAVTLHPISFPHETRIRVDLTLPAHLDVRADVKAFEVRCPVCAELHACAPRRPMDPAEVRALEDAGARNVARTPGTIPKDAVWRAVVNLAQAIVSAAPGGGWSAERGRELALDVLQLDEKYS